MENENNLISRELPTGTSLFNGLYTIEKVLGSGGFGITYKAKQSGLDKTVCIKEFFIYGKCVRQTQAKTVFLQGVTNEMFEKYRQKFVEEAKLLSNLNHKNIVRVNHVFDENNTSYMVMDYIEGTTLQSIVENNGTLEYTLTVNYLGQIAEAVQYIHARNILHRDIKPDNIMITPEYQAILIDFGSAREFVEDKTQQHTAMLTKCYAPPEQYNTVSRKGSYSDIYALGAVYYFAMTGKAPMEATTRHIEVMPEAITINPEISNDANRTIHKAMAMKPELRHQTVQEFLDDLYGVKPSEPFVDEVEIVKLIEKKKKKMLIIVAAALIIMVGVIMGFIMDSKIKVGKIRENITKEFYVEVAHFYDNKKSAEKLYYDNPYYNIEKYKASKKRANEAIEKFDIARNIFEKNKEIFNPKRDTTLFKKYQELSKDYQNLLILKDSINVKIIKLWLKVADETCETAKNYKDKRFYYDFALDFCDSVLKIDNKNIKALEIKNEINKIINNIK